jgi:branched-chain amino acid transport system substrate-binding protein
MNDKGGLNGHEVRYFVYDDGGDPARHRSQVREAIERRHVIAFVQSNETLTGKSMVDYITAKRVPMVGGDTGDNWWYESPMYFPQASSGDALYEATIYSIAEQTVPAGKTKLGTIFCAEIQACDDIDRFAAEHAPKAGFEHVYRAKASVAQPDFTAECLAARQAGVEVLLMGLDANSIGRVGTACARQAYRPVYATLASVPVPRMQDDPNLDGLTAGSPVFPFFQSGTPATDEWQRVMRTYGIKVSLGASAAFGWVSAKLFEKATANLSEPPTSEAVLQGLWAIRNDSLGDITQPLTFIKDQPADPVVCWFNIAINDNLWVSPNAFKMHCR